MKSLVKSCLVIAYLSAAACGQDGKIDPNAFVVAPAASPTPGAEAGNKEDTKAAAAKTKETTSVITEGRQVLSLKVETRKALPVCSEEIQSQLSYVTSEKQFYVCDENDWVVISIKGDKGDKGEQGLAGLKGEQGLRGEKGEKGEQGLQGEQGEQGEQGLQGLQGVAGINGTNGTNGANGTNGQDGQSMGVRLTSESAGANCANGGQKLQSYVDTNRNGSYDNGETLMGSASYVCNGTNGTANTIASTKTCQIPLANWSAKPNGTLSPITVQTAYSIIWQRVKFASGDVFVSAWMRRLEGSSVAYGALGSAGSAYKYNTEQDTGAVTRWFSASKIANPGAEYWYASNLVSLRMKIIAPSGSSATMPFGDGGLWSFSYTEGHDRLEVWYNDNDLYSISAFASAATTGGLSMPYSLYSEYTGTASGMCTSY